MTASVQQATNTIVLVMGKSIAAAAVGVAG
jgi:hypothetical protein